ncbi:unnamed protein product [Camellia sinensis]
MVEVKEVFEYFPQLPSDSLIGVRIVHVFALPDAPEEEYQSTSLKLLTRRHGQVEWVEGNARGGKREYGGFGFPGAGGGFFSEARVAGNDGGQDFGGGGGGGLGGGTGLVGDLSTTMDTWHKMLWKRFHKGKPIFLPNFVKRKEEYITLVSALTLPLRTWTFGRVEASKYSLLGMLRSMVEITCVMIIPLHDYEAHVARHFGNCSFDELFRAFSRIFIGALAYLVIDHFFALRILRRNIELVQQGEPVPAKKPWENLTDEKRIESFIRGTHQIECGHSFGNHRLLGHILTDHSQSYCLPTKSVFCSSWVCGVILYDRLREVLHLTTDDEILQHMRGVFRDVLDCFNTLSPEVG